MKMIEGCFAPSENYTVDAYADGRCVVTVLRDESESTLHSIVDGFERYVAKRQHAAGGDPQQQQQRLVWIIDVMSTSSLPPVSLGAHISEFIKKFDAKISDHLAGVVVVISGKAVRTLVTAALALTKRNVIVRTAENNEKAMAKAKELLAGSYSKKRGLLA